VSHPYDLIIIGGAPGVGKSTLMQRLCHYLDMPPRLEFSTIREIHLDYEWKRESPEEEAMSFEILQQIIPIYMQHGRTPLLLTDFKDERLASFESAFKDFRYMILTLYTSEGEEIKQRVGARTSGFRDIESAIYWNRRIETRPDYAYEHRMDIQGLSPDQVFQKALQIVNHVPH
jgi:hypothetical protein